MVNNTRLTAPFTINAIGDPDIISQALEMPGGILEELGAFGLNITLEKKDSIVIPAYDLPVRYRLLDTPSEDKSRAPTESAKTPPDNSEAIEVKKGGSDE